MAIVLLHLDTYSDHKLQATFRDFRWEPSAKLADELLAQGAFVAVATSTELNWQDIWELTQNGPNPSWSKSPPTGLKALGGGAVSIDGKSLGYRSSDIGDLILVDDEIHMVVGIGFTALELPMPAPEKIRVINGGTLADVRAAELTTPSPLAYAPVSASTP